LCTPDYRKPNRIMSLFHTDVFPAFVRIGTKTIWSISLSVLWICLENIWETIHFFLRLQLTWYFRKVCFLFCFHIQKSYFFSSNILPYLIVQHLIVLCLSPISFSRLWIRCSSRLMRQYRLPILPSYLVVSSAGLRSIVNRR